MYVVLAAGRAARMGFDKVLAPLAGRSPLERIVDALGERRFIVVVPSRLAPDAARLAGEARVAMNDDPDLGMTHSLKVALRKIDADRDFGVLLGDMPAIAPAVIEQTEQTLWAPQVDVAYPVDEHGHPGHPVIFSSRARAIVEALPPGDTLRTARDHPSLQRATWTCTQRGAFCDLDDRSQWEAFSDA